MQREAFLRAYKSNLTGTGNLGTDIGITTEYEEVDEFLDIYQRVYKSIPYPLSDIEENIKYATILDSIKAYYKNKGIDFNFGNNIWLGDGIQILIKGKKVMHISRTSYRYYTLTDTKTEQKKVTLQLYIVHKLYKMFNWIYDKWKEGKSTRDFYIVFYREILEEIKGDKKKLEYKLANYFEREQVGLINSLKEGRILELNQEYSNFTGLIQTIKEYTLDIYKEEVDTGKPVESIVVTQNNKVEIRQTTEKRDCYKYKVYLKEDGKEQMHISIDGFASVFSTVLMSDRYLKEYKGVIVGRTIVFETGGYVYTTNKDYYTDAVCLGIGRLQGYYDNKVYWVGISEFDSSTLLETLQCIEPVDSSQEFWIGTEHLQRQEQLIHTTINEQLSLKAGV